MCINQTLKRRLTRMDALSLKPEQRQKTEQKPWPSSFQARRTPSFSLPLHSLPTETPHWHHPFVHHLSLRNDSQKSGARTHLATIIIVQFNLTWRITPLCWLLRPGRRNSRPQATLISLFIARIALTISDPHRYQC